MRLRISVLPALLLVAAVAAAGEPPPTVVKSFSLKHRTVTEASQLVQLFLSDTGSLTMHPQQGLVTVQDRADVIRVVSGLLKAYDTAPVPFVLQVELWQASNKHDKSGDSHVDPRVRRLFQYASFRKVAQARVESDGSSPLHADLGPTYLLRSAAVQRRLQFPRYPMKLPDRKTASAAGTKTARAKPAKELTMANSVQYPEKEIRRLLSSERIVLQNLSLVRREAAPGGRELLRQVLRTNVVLSLHQRVVLGASAAEDSGRALLLILKVEPLGRGGKS